MEEEEEKKKFICRKRALLCLNVAISSGENRIF